MDKKRALKLIIFFGLVSLFGDIVYEGARSVNGPFLNILGASAALVGLIAGVGEFSGYALRLLSGYVSDRAGLRWFFVILGYIMLAAVPLLSLAGHWQLAACLIIAERIGKAVRSPARDTIVSQAAKEVGTGWGFGITEALDQIGALSGPLIFTGLFFFFGTAGRELKAYQQGYALLWLPFILLLICVFAAYRRFPHSEQAKTDNPENSKSEKFPKVFWLYIAFTFVATMGFANFLLLGYHFKVKHIFSDALIPLMYAIAMGVDGVTALVIGKAYDILKKKNNQTAGLTTLIVIPVFSILLAVFAFSGNFLLAVCGMIFWGVVMGAHETIMRSAIADITHINRRGAGYGIFNAGYGLAMFLGSTALGFLYDYSHMLVIVAVTVIEAIALFLFFLLRNEALRFSDG